MSPPLPARPANRRFSAGLAALLVFGVLVRTPFLPRLGHAYDADAYRIWMGAIQDHGLAQVFERTDTDYVGYHYILWALGKGYGKSATRATVRDKSLRVWLKLPSVAGDLLTAGLIALLARALVAGADRRRLDAAPIERGAIVRKHALDAAWLKAGVARRESIEVVAPRDEGAHDSRTRLARRLGLPRAEATGLAVAALFLFHPAVIYAGSYWGQQDSLVAFFMLLACWLGWRNRPLLAGLTLALGVMVKPQPLIIAPLLVWIIWQRSGWRGLTRAALTGALVLLLGHAYFLSTGNAHRMLDIYLFQLTQNEHLSYAAYNLWWPFDRLAGARPDTVIVSLAGVALTYGTLATVLVVAALAFAGRALRRPDALAVLLAGGVFLETYFAVASGSHERYALPSLVFLLPALPLVPRLRWPLLLFSLCLTANLVIGLPLDRRWRQGDPTWLTIIVSLLAVLATVGLIWVAELSSRARLRVVPTRADA